MDVDAAVSAEMTFNFALAFLQDDAHTSLFPRRARAAFALRHCAGEPPPRLRDSKPSPNLWPLPNRG